MTKILFSPYKNPYLNLAIEDSLLRSCSEEVLLFYVNRPCLVFGRFQNPWIEGNLPWAAKNNIWPVRRQSGGGTVFHDEGNLNYSYLYPGSLKARNFFLFEIQKVFEKINLKLDQSSRNDLWIDGKKISGSAYKQTKKSSFHHGTLLISSNLDLLEESLLPTFDLQKTKSIASVRSKVTRLVDHQSDLTINTVIELFKDHFKTDLSEFPVLNDEIMSQFMFYYSKGWIWNETPYFEYKNLKIQKGKIVDFDQEFSRSTISEYLSSDEINQFFPVFNEQHMWSSLF